MGAIVPHQFNTLIIIRCDDGQFAIAVNFGCQIDDRAVNFKRQRLFCQTFGNRRSKFHTGHRRFHIAGGTIRQGQRNHVRLPFFVSKSQVSKGHTKVRAKSQQARDQNRVRHPDFRSGGNAKCGGEKARDRISDRDV